MKSEVNDALLLDLTRAPMTIAGKKAGDLVLRWTPYRLGKASV